ncbi:MAG: NUDIX domain-containing protein, partial [Bacteroidetes bacterium]|nr:NUDIX domain-containing protein [Bacteroidota bacterium]
AILFNEEGQFLIARKKRKSLAGFWEFPGGKVEENEIEEDALKREMVEEFSVEIEQLKLYHAYDFSYSETDYHFLIYSSISESSAYDSGRSRSDILDRSAGIKTIYICTGRYSGCSIHP